MVKSLCNLRLSFYTSQNSNHAEHKRQQATDSNSQADKLYNL